MGKKTNPPIKKEICEKIKSSLKRRNNLDYSSDRIQEAWNNYSKFLGVEEAKLPDDEDAIIGLVLMFDGEI